MLLEQLFVISEVTGASSVTQFIHLILRSYFFDVKIYIGPYIFDSLCSWYRLKGEHNRLQQSGIA